MLIRTIILYLVVVSSMRLMGKKQIGQLQPFELAVAIMISELAALPMQDNRVPLMDGIIPIITLLILQITVSILELKSEKMRIWFNGKPSILIKDGKIDINELYYQQLNINDLMEELRLKDIYNLDDIEYAILETSGQLSIIPKTELSNVTKEDLKIKVSQETLPITLILDGKLNTNNLKIANKNKKWLKSQLKLHKIKSYEEVFIAIIDSKGKFYCQAKNDQPN